MYPTLRHASFLRFTAGLAAAALLNAPCRSAAADPVKLEIQHREPMYSRGGAPSWIRRQTIQLDPSKTAVVVVDMWNGHSCKTATKRLGQLVGPMNETLAAARKLGMPVVFAPTLGSIYANAQKVYPKEPEKHRFYEGSPQRKATVALPEHPLLEALKFDPPPFPKFAVPDHPCGGVCKGKPGPSPKYRMHTDLVIAPGDYIADSTQEMWNFCCERGITHLVYVGVAANICLAGKPCAVIPMTRLGLECVVVRDLTQAHPPTYWENGRKDGDPSAKPDLGTRISIRHYERSICPTIDRRQILFAAGIAEPERAGPKRPVEPVFSPEEVKGYTPRGASHCFRHFCFDYNWCGGDIEDYFTRANPAQFAEFCKQINMDGVLLLAVPHQGYCTYETEIGEKFPGMKGDWFGQTVKELHNRGIAALGYITLARNCKYALEHPEHAWDRNGERFLCLNTPYLDLVAAYSQEVLRKYPVDALRYDTLEVPLNHRCEHCEKFYRELYGEEMPEKWDAADWRRQYDFARATSTRATRRLYEACKAVKPQIEVWQNGFMAHPGFDRNDLEAARWQDMAYVEHSDPFRQIFLQDVLRAKGSVVGRILHSPDRRLCMALGGACYTYERVSRYDVLPPDRRWYFEDVKPFYAMVADVEQYVDGSSPVRCFGMVYCESTRFRNDKYDRSGYVKLLRRITESYLKRSLVPEFISNLDLPSDSLSRFKLLVLPETSGLRPQDLAALRAYMAAGGQLLVVGDALRYDENGLPRKDFALAGEMGVSFRGVVGPGSSAAAGWSWRNTRLDGKRATVAVRKAGPQTLNVWMREDGTPIDKILLTTDAEYTPSGNGPEPNDGGLFLADGSRKGYVIEAEDAAENIARAGQAWKVLQTPAGFSGRGYARAMPDGVAGTKYQPPGFETTAPELRYRVKFERPGTYYVWFRQAARNASQDSVHVGIDDKPLLTTAFYQTTRGIIGAGGAAGRTVRLDVTDAWQKHKPPLELVADRWNEVRVLAGQTPITGSVDNRTFPVLHAADHGKGRIVYLASSSSTTLIVSTIDALAGPPPVIVSGDKRVVFTRQAKQNRWILHLISQGEYTVDIHRDYAIPTRIVEQYPVQGWSCDLTAIDTGVRITVTGAADNRLLILQ